MLLVAGKQGFSQTFNGYLHLGTNISQVRGDGLTGLNRGVAHAGLGISTQCFENVECHLELIYNQKGSAKSLTFWPDNKVPGIELHYADIPIYLAFKDWKDDSGPGQKDFYRMRYLVGFSVGRLLRAKMHELNLESNGNDRELLDNFTKVDMSWLIGTTIYLSGNLAIHLRYSRSITPLFDDKINSDISAQSLLGSFITFRLTYQL